MLCILLGRLSQTWAILNLKNYHKVNTQRSSFIFVFLPVLRCQNNPGINQLGKPLALKQEAGGEENEGSGPLSRQLSGGT